MNVTCTYIYTKKQPFANVNTTQLATTQYTCNNMFVFTGIVALDAK